MRRALGVAFVAFALVSGMAALLRGEPASAPDAREDVVLLHGLGRTDRAMRPLARALTRAGYRVHNLTYPSLAEQPAQLVEIVQREVDACCAESPKLHFVTHSLGGLIARAALAERPRPNLGRVVMLAPPNNGSEYADLAREARLADAERVPAIAALGTDPTSFARRLPAPDYAVGVIAGTRSVNPLGPVVVGSANDGVVSVVSAQLPGMTDFLAVDATHASIRRRPDVHAQVIAFLRTGRFVHAPQSAGDAAR